MKRSVLAAVGEIAVMVAFFVWVGWYFGNHQPAHPVLARVEPTASIQATIVAYVIAAAFCAGMSLFGFLVWRTLNLKKQKSSPMSQCDKNDTRSPVLY